MQEDWIEIPTCPTYYISNLGRVKRVKFVIKYNSYSTKILKQYEDKYGYLYVRLVNSEGLTKNYKVHRLVAQSFLEDYSEVLQVNHKDENKHNNMINNLEMCNNQYNCSYGTHRTRLSKAVIQSTLEGEMIKEWESTRAIERALGFSNTAISNCCRGYLKDSHNGKTYPVHQAFGYKWNYKD